MFRVCHLVIKYTSRHLFNPWFIIVVFGLYLVIGVEICTNLISNMAIMEALFKFLLLLLL